MSKPPMKRFRSCITAFAFVLVALLGPTETTALEIPYQHTDSSVRSAMLFRFAQFTTWPDSSFPDAKSPFVIAIDDPDLFRTATTTLSQKNIKSRPIRIVAWEAGTVAPDCQLLYTRNAAPPKSSRAILTIGNHAGFAEAGGAIELVQSEGRIRFIINLVAAQRAGLVISSEMLNLALRVTTGERP